MSRRPPSASPNHPQSTYITFHLVCGVVGNATAVYTFYVVHDILRQLEREIVSVRRVCGLWPKKKKKRVGGKTFPQNSNEAFHDYININIVLFFSEINRKST